jgi:predicted CopG family antitoxin
MQVKEKCLLCPNEDESLAASISSLVNKQQDNPILAQIIQEPTFRKEGLLFNKQQTEQEQPVREVEEKKPESISITKEDYERLLKEVEGKKQSDEQVTRLLNKDRTNTLNSIFKSVKDENVKKTLFDKYFELKVDADILNGFAEDLTAHVFPSLLEEAKAQAVEESKKEAQPKSKAASLPKEPEIQKQETVIVPNRQNQVKQFDRLMRGFQ